MALSPERARDMATDMLLHVLDRPEMVTQFLAATGLRPEDLRSMAKDPEAAGALFDYMVEDDARLLECAEALRVRPQDLMAARTALSGPGSYGWSVD